MLGWLVVGSQKQHQSCQMAIVSAASKELYLDNGDIL